jgi:hypothetical protein
MPQDIPLGNRSRRRCRPRLTPPGPRPANVHDHVGSAACTRDHGRLLGSGPQWTSVITPYAGVSRKILDVSWGVARHRAAPGPPTRSMCGPADDTGLDTSTSVRPRAVPNTGRSPDGRRTRADHRLPWQPARPADKDDPGRVGSRRGFAHLLPTFECRSTLPARPSAVDHATLVQRSRT